MTCDHLAPALAQEFNLDLERVKQVILTSLSDYKKKEDNYLQTLLKPIDGIYSHGECEPLDLDMSVFHNKQQVYMLRPPLKEKDIRFMTPAELRGRLGEDYHIKPDKKAFLEELQTLLISAMKN